MTSNSKLIPHPHTRPFVAPFFYLTESHFTFSLRITSSAPRTISHPPPLPSLTPSSSLKFQPTHPPTPLYIPTKFAFTPPSAPPLPNSPSHLIRLLPTPLYFTSPLYFPSLSSLLININPYRLHVSHHPQLPPALPFFFLSQPSIPTAPTFSLYPHTLLGPFSLPFHSPVSPFLPRRLLPLGKPHTHHFHHIHVPPPLPSLPATHPTPLY